MQNFVGCHIECIGWQMWQTSGNGLDVLVKNEKVLKTRKLFAVKAVVQIIYVFRNVGFPHNT